MVQDVEGYVSQEARGLEGTCKTPGNPNIALMALALAAKSEGTSVIRHCSQRPVVAPFISALTALGISVTHKDGDVVVCGESLKAQEEPFQIGQSDLLLGCLAGMTAGAEFHTKFEGGAQAGSVIAALEALGARVDKPVEGVYPFAVGGRDLTGAKYTIKEPDIAVKTAFFLAGLDASGDVHLEQSSSGDDDFEVLLKASGVAFEKEKEVGKEGYHLVMPNGQNPQGVLHDLPGDPGAALYLLGVAAMLPRSELILHYVGNDWKTRRMLELLRRFNAQLEIQVARSESKFAIRTVTAKPSELRRTRIGGDQTALFLDEVPFLAVLGTQAAGETVIRDAQKLREGEVDCLALMAENLRRLGAKVGEMPDGLVVQGPVSLQGAELDAGGDTRVAVALVLASLVAEGETQIANVGSLTEDFAELFSCLETVVNAKR
ncbi:MAG: 3-phosphoshikimate 1-carboxyvinyltransferase [Candidatus Latescibacterota bacterium]|jgi:3-phosphoshikimate 1-carboxyvinyltransferase